MSRLCGKDKRMIVAMFRVLLVCAAMLIGKDEFAALGKVLKPDFVEIKKWSGFPEDLV